MANKMRSSLAGPQNKTRPTYVGRVFRPGVLGLVLLGLWAAGLAPLGAFGPAPEATPAATVTDFSLDSGRRITTITIETSDPVAYLTTRPDPLTLLVDLRHVDARAGLALVKPKGVVAGASVEDATAADGTKIARVYIRLTQPASHQVRSRRNRIHIDFDSAFPVGTIGNAAPVAAVPGKAAARVATLLERVQAKSEPSGTSVTFSGNGELVAEAVTPVGNGTPSVVLDFPNLKSMVPADVFVGRGPVSAIHVKTTGTGAAATTRVVVDLLRPATYRVMPPEEGEKDFTILFEDQAPPVVAAAPVAAAPAVASLDPIDRLLMRGGLGAGADPQVTAPARGTPGAFSPARGAGPFAQVPQQGAIPQLPPVAAPGAAQQPPRFTGHPVTLDFQGADLRMVLRTFADISGLNIVIDQSVQGSVDVSLNQVPWDQALDIILRDHKLGYSVDGTIVRIAPMSVLADEEAQRRKLAEERALSGELEVLTRPLSYARAADLTALLTRTALSARGDIQIDPRTNTIIIRDLPSRLQSAAQLLDALDQPQPQVEIEARIVTTTRAFARDLGVRWGFTGRVAPELGNTTGLAFPNQGSLSGRTGSIGADGAATAVDLGVSPATSALGLALGSVNGAFNLDLELSALEASGNGRILSSPRVATQNNVPAEITQGVQVPIQTVANNTVTVTFRDAALRLQVTPQITAANTVIMQVQLENSSPDFTRAVNGIPPIDTQRAVTSLLVSDGQTSVIGGIYVNRQQENSARTPAIYKVPILGWLFKNQRTTDQSSELLIFITPRIIKLG